jgi:uncharacterized protein (TIGR03435 family)
MGAGMVEGTRAIWFIVLSCGLAASVLSSTGTAQSKLSFDVASIKRKPPGPVSGGGFRYLPGGRFTALNVNVSQLLSGAYPGIRAALGDIVGPEWIFGERFDVLASAGREATREEMGLMIKTMLEDRFKLRAHMERQMQPVWELIIARSDGALGPELKPHKDECGRPGSTPCGVSASREAVRGIGVPISRLATFFTASVDGRRIFDKTGLTGNYDFKLVYRPSGAPPREPGAPPDDRPMLFTALEEQLGLKLVASRGVVDVLVIDSIDHPTEN